VRSKSWLLFGLHCAIRQTDSSFCLSQSGGWNFRPGCCQSAAFHLWCRGKAFPIVSDYRQWPDLWYLPEEPPLHIVAPSIPLIFPEWEPIPSDVARIVAGG